MVLGTFLLILGNTAGVGGVAVEGVTFTKTGGYGFWLND